MYPLVLCRGKYYMFNCSYLLLMYKKAGTIIFDDDRRRLDLRTKSFKTLYLSQALCWKNICIYCMREVCAFSGMGKMVHLYFLNLFVFHLVYLLLLYLCIYWILFKSFWIFVIVFQGLLCGLYLQRGVFLRSR